MNAFMTRAKELEPELIESRRKIHSFGGVGFEIQPTTDLIVEKLKEYGYEPKIIAKTGVICTVGSGEKTFLLRADMDALPMEEENDLPFRATNGTAHTCGHDCHAAMLLTAARLLKERESELCGTVKLMFQPAEEIMAGARAMVEAGVLDNPKVDAAFAIHVTMGHADFPTGAFRYCNGPSLGSTDQFKITVKGVGCHGAYPCRGVDPIGIASKIVTATRDLIAMETAVTEQSVITFGKFIAGTAPNVIPETAVLEGTIRTLSSESRNFLKKRFQEMAEGIARAFRGEAIVEYVKGIGVCSNDLAVLDCAKRYAAELVGEEKLLLVPPVNGSEDFAAVSEQVPAAFFWMGAGTPEEGCAYRVHHPKAVVNESSLYLGAATLANVAFRWLEEHQ